VINDRVRTEMQDGSDLGRCVFVGDQVQDLRFAGSNGVVHNVCVLCV